MAVSNSLRRFQNQLEFYPNITNSQLKKFILKDIHALEILIPGEGSKGYEKRMAELYQLLIETP